MDFHLRVWLVVTLAVVANGCGCDCRAVAVRPGSDAAADTGVDSGRDASGAPYDSGPAYEATIGDASGDASTCSSVQLTDWHGQDIWSANRGAILQCDQLSVVFDASEANLLGALEPTNCPVTAVDAGTQSCILPIDSFAVIPDELLDRLCAIRDGLATERFECIVFE